MDRRMDVQFAPQSAHFLRACLVATFLLTALPIYVLAQGDGVPMAPTVHFERLPPVKKNPAPLRVLDRLPPLEAALNPAKPGQARQNTQDIPDILEATTQSEPVTPSTLAEPNVLLQRMPKSYAQPAPQRTGVSENRSPKQLDVVDTLGRVSAISENQLVQRHIQTGFVLAHRGAYYSAKCEFEQALRVIAESLDAQQLNGKHGEQLTAAFDAIAEADDFFVDDPRSGGRVDLRNVAVTHRTPLLQEGKLEGANQVGAMQAY